MLVSFSAERALLVAALDSKNMSNPFEPPRVFGEGGLEERAMSITEEVDTESRTCTTDDCFFGVDKDRTSSPPLIECVDLPLRAHILAGSYGWPSAIFPIFAVADAINIIPLVSSAVCQRAVWDIQLPVVALEISKVGRIGYVHIGWAEQSKSQGVVSYSTYSFSAPLIKIPIRGNSR